MKLALTTRRGMLVVAFAFAWLHVRAVSDQYAANSWLFGDGSFYFTTLRALVEHGRLGQRDLQPQSWYVQDLGWNKELTDDWSNVALGRHGTWYPKHCILVPLVGMPGYWVFGTIGTLFTNIAMNLVFVLLAFLLARRFASVGAAVVAAIVVTALPFVKDMSYSFSNDILGADLVLGSLECALAGWFGWAGVLAGFSLWSRVTNAAFLPALAIIGVDAGGWRKVGRAALFSFIPLGIYGALNTYMFGAPWITSYQRVLVREDGRLTMASHSRLFNVPWGEGLHRIVMSEDGAFQSCPPLALAIIGFIGLAYRRLLQAEGMMLFLILPVLVFAKYDWYRPHFLYALYGLSAAGMAAFVGTFPWFVPRPEPSRPLSRTARRGIVLGLAACIPLGILWRATHVPSPYVLSNHMHEAEVILDTIPCDYWNPQAERWECSHYDNGGDAMTGRTLQPDMVGGVLRSAMSVTPVPPWRRIIFHKLPGSRIGLSFSLDDQSRAGTVKIEVVGKGPAEALEIDQPGKEKHLIAELGTGDGPSLEIRVRADQALDQHVIFEGRMQ